MRLTPPTTRAHEPYFDLVCWTRAKSSFLGALGLFLLCCDPMLLPRMGLSEHYQSIISSFLVAYNSST